MNMSFKVVYDMKGNRISRSLEPCEKGPDLKTAAEIIEGWMRAGEKDKSSIENIHGTVVRTMVQTKKEKATQ